MSALDHWHPVYEAGKLRAKPVSVQLCGRQIVLFRAGDRIGALDDCCPHRRMRLSQGEVVGDRLQCRYHAWTFDCAGAGESPGTPKLHAQAGCYEVAERHDWIWLRAAGAASTFPEFEVAGYRFVGALAEVFNVPLEIVLDNFTEVEHTPTTHALLGYELSRMHEVETRVEVTDGAVRVYNAGPQKRIPPLTSWLFGVRAGDQFVDDWTTKFSPVYACYDQYWSDANTRAEKGARWRIYVFFNPLDDERTQLVVFAHLRPDPQGGWRNWLLFKPSLLWLIQREVTLDRQILELLADKRPGLEGMKLSRFDKVLGLHRARIASLYRGEIASATQAVDASGSSSTRHAAGADLL
ncbi:MAG: Rieske 2Fe-2S domain-containing protein [Pirellulales bacterium]|nr:Rieske 2Fe-2S domain-containing protein [Pirellulales bacterium]